MFNLLIQQQNDVLINEKFDTFESLKHYLVEKGVDVFSSIPGTDSNLEGPNFEQVENLDDIKAIFKKYNSEHWNASISRDE